MSRAIVIALFALAPVATALQQPLQPPPARGPATAPPDTEIFLAPLAGTGNAVTVGQPVNITNSPGYDNQPSFTPDGRGILFTSVRGGGTQTDIYRYDIGSGSVTRVTATPESEYSATVTPDGEHISVIRVEGDGTQRLWRFTLDGRQPELVLADVKPVGYHAWADDHTLALFVLGQPATLQIADTRTGKAEVLVSGIGRSLQAIPSTVPSMAGARTISFVERSSARVPGAADAAPTLSIREWDPRTRRVTPLVSAVTGAREADCAWTPDGLLVMADKDVLYGWHRASTGSGQAGWRRVADLAALGLHGVTRIAISPAGDRIAFVAEAR